MKTTHPEWPNVPSIQQIGGKLPNSEIYSVEYELTNDNEYQISVLASDGVYLFLSTTGKWAKNDPLALLGEIAGASTGPAGEIYGFRD